MAGNSYLTVVSGLGYSGLFYFFLALLLYYVSVLLYAFRWKIVLKAMGRDVSYFSLVKAFLSSIFINNITPLSRSGGEILRIAWLNKLYKIPAAVSTASVLYERLIEAFPLLILLFIAAFYFVSYPIYLTIGFGLLILLLWVKWEKLVEIAARLSKTSVTPGEIRSVAKIRRKLSLNLTVFTLSSIIWALDVLRLKFITLAVGLHLSLTLVALISIANFAFGMIAFTPGGVGIVEGGLIGTLVFFGIPFALALSVTLLERLISYVISSITGFITLVVGGGADLWKALRSH